MAMLFLLGLLVPACAYAVEAGSASGTLAGRIFTVAGALRWTGPADQSQLATRTSLRDPAVAAMPDGGFLIANGSDVLRVSLSGRVAIVAGGGTYGSLGDGGPATKAYLDDLTDVAALPHGGFLIADSNYRVREVWPDGHISTVAGTGQSGFSGDGGPATKAAIEPRGIAVMPDGGFLIADSNYRVREVWPDGHISTVAGTGQAGFSGDGGPATRARLGPEDVAALPHGGFLIADAERVRRVGPDGRISTVAGNGQWEETGDGGPARSAGVGWVYSVAVMPGGGFLIGTDPRVRRVWPDGHISTVTGNANGDLYGDGGAASAAQLYSARFHGSYGLPSVAVLSDGSTLVGYGSTVRMVVSSRGTALLAAAIRPQLSSATRNAYRARVVLTEPAQLTLRVYSSPKRRLIATAHAFKPAGESTMLVKLGSHINAGLYAIDLRAQNGAQATRAEQYAYLGASLTKPTVRWIERRILADKVAGSNDTATTTGCHRFSALRIDCAIELRAYLNRRSYVARGEFLGVGGRSGRGG